MDQLYPSAIGNKRLRITDKMPLKGSTVLLLHRKVHSCAEKQRTLYAMLLRTFMARSDTSGNGSAAR